MEVEATVAVSRGGTVSERIYGLNWRKHFPLDLGGGLSVDAAPAEEGLAFMRRNFAEIYRDSPPGAFLTEEYNDNKLRYYREAGDFFLFREGAKPVGIFVGTPVDWSTYFFRNCSILPEYQGKKIYQKLLVHLLKVLPHYGIDRVEGDVSPANLGHIHILNKLQFNIAGLRMTERWGSLLHFTKYLSPKHEQVFLDQYCHGVRPQVKTTRETSTDS